MHADMKGFASPPGGGHHGFYSNIQMDGWIDLLPLQRTLLNLVLCQKATNNKWFPVFA